MRCFWKVLSCLAFAIPFVSFGSLVYVSPSGDNASSGAGWGTAKRTIAAGITAAGAGGEVWIAAGIYNERLQVTKAYKIVGGFAGTETSAAERQPGNDTIIDAQNTGRVFRADNAVGLTLDNLTLRNGFADGYYGGGGLYLYHCSNTTLTNVRIEGCSAPDPKNGGGAYLSGGSFTITDLAIDSSHADGGTGGGLYSIGSSLTANHVNLSNCSALRGGGGAFYGCTGTLRNGDFRLNKALSAGTEGGGGAWVSACQQLTFASCFFYSNTANCGGALDVCGGSINNYQNCIFGSNKSNSAAIYIRDSVTSPRFSNPTIADNVSTASGPSALYIDAGAYLSIANPILAYNTGGVAAFGHSPQSGYTWWRGCFWANTPTTFEISAELPSANYFGDPQFLSRAFLDIPSAYDIQPSSYAVDRGFTEGPDDFSLGSRPLDGNNDGSVKVDNGAFEFQVVSQHAVLDGWVGRAEYGQSSRVLSYEVYDEHGLLAASGRVAQSPTGYYTLCTDELGPGESYRVFVSCAGYLRKLALDGTLPANRSVGWDVALRGGDVDGDGVVGLQDLNAVVLDFLSLDSLADINGDGQVDVLDLNLVLVSFLIFGD